MNKILVLAVVSVFSSCMKDPIIPPPPHLIGDGGVCTNDKGTDCIGACYRLKELGCEEASEVDGGLACEETCLKILKHDMTPFDTACVAVSCNVQAVRACPAIRCKR